MKNKDVYEVTFTDLEKITGLNYRTVRRKLVQINPVREDLKSSYYSLKEVLSVLYAGTKNEKERVTIEEIKARTRNWTITADRSEIKKKIEEGSVCFVNEVETAFSTIFLAFKSKLESIPGRLAALDAADYHGRLEIAQQIVDECLMEMNEHAVRECSSGLKEPGSEHSEADTSP